MTSLLFLGFLAWSWRGLLPPPLPVPYLLAGKVAVFTEMPAGAALAATALAGAALAAKALAATVLAEATFTAADARAWEPAGADLRVTARDGFDATFFT